jgi:hypothetical protein
MADRKRAPNWSPPALCRAQSTLLQRLSRKHAIAVVVLAAAIGTLTVLAGPHLLEHLLGVGGDPDHCAVCTWSHSAGTGTPSMPPTFVSALPFDGNATSLPPIAVPAVALATPAPRAPPSVA